MKPVVEVDGARVFQGDCREVLRGLPDNSVDSVVTDPPYELGFMGKSWDSSGVAYDVNLWMDCLRVLKPGGHILAFGGSRTWHRLAVAIEDAGFELRDSIAWLYGSGFPKSLDVSKAIDKSDAKVERRARDLRFVNWMRSTGLKASEINKIIGKSDVGSHYLRIDQPVVATAELFDKLRPYLPDVPEDIERLVFERTVESKNFAEREVIGQQRQGRLAVAPGQGEDRSAIDLDITLAKTPQAQKWQGWGTALKPAFEPVVVGRKPLVGTVAENVLAWGVGGLNIDGSRIGTEVLPGQTRGVSKIGTFEGADGNITPERAGRWPANVILDEVTAGLLDEQSGVSKSAEGGGTRRTALGRMNDDGWQPKETEMPGYGDSGGASRFFYVAKASKRDRNEGLEELEAQRHSDRVKDDGVGGDNPRNRTNQARQNFHPTVKPTQLMRYLIKLVTPPGGTVLDPFTGSGSTGKAALLDGFKFVGAELTKEYLPIIEGRLRWASEQTEDDTLF